MKTFLRACRWGMLCVGVSVPHLVPHGVAWPCQLACVATAATLDFWSMRFK